jgi:hypothetical protein
MTSATEELRRLLDERGVEWEDGGEGLTIIPVQDGVPQAWTVDTWPSGKDMGDCLWVQNRHPLTPEQAIAATLGAGTCSITDNGPWGYPYVCSECGASFDTDVNNGEINFCPNCGRRVVE